MHCVYIDNSQLHTCMTSVKVLCRMNVLMLPIECQFAHPSQLLNLNFLSMSVCSSLNRGRLFKASSPNGSLVHVLCPFWCVNGEYSYKEVNVPKTNNHFWTGTFHISGRSQVYSLHCMNTC
jgi:hypothetical protein